MTPIDQTRFGIDGSEPPGNCYQACIASILDLQLSDVPDEIDDWKPGDPPRVTWKKYFPRMEAWLRERSLHTVSVPVSAVFYEGQIWDPLLILSGQSPRNPDVLHAVVAKGLTIVHDPHPSRAGLANVQESWWYEFFVRSK